MRRNLRASNKYRRDGLSPRFAKSLILPGILQESRSDIKIRRYPKFNGFFGIIILIYGVKSIDEGDWLVNQPNQPRTMASGLGLAFDTVSQLLLRITLWKDMACLLCGQSSKGFTSYRRSDSVS